MTWVEVSTVATVYVSTVLGLKPVGAIAVCGDYATTPQLNHFCRENGLYAVTHLPTGYQLTSRRLSIPALRRLLADAQSLPVLNAQTMAMHMPLVDRIVDAASAFDGDIFRKAAQ